ncbi:MAG: hypothetical protein RL885_17765 [Planctomycetota bacterium]
MNHWKVSSSASDQHLPQCPTRKGLRAKLVLCLVALSGLPVGAQYDSPYWRTPDGNLDADQQEYSTDEGGLLFDDVLKDFINISSFNWENPSSIDAGALATFGWLDASVLTRCVDFRDPVLNTTTTLEYD